MISKFRNGRAPRVTCIIIFHNEKRFLAEAVNSVRLQTYQDWELLLVDDGSTDGSDVIARSFAVSCPDQIHYLTHSQRQNRGMSASRNLGIENARGFYVAFLDGDDTWLETKLDAQVALFERYPSAGMVCGATEYWYSWNNAAGSDRLDRVVNVGETADGVNTLRSRLKPGDDSQASAFLVEPPELLRVLRPLGPGASPSTSGFMVRRDTFAAVGGFENVFTGLFEDQAFKTKVYLNMSVCVSSLCFDRYRRHDQSCTMKARAAASTLESELSFLRWLRSYLYRQGCRDWTIFGRVLWAFLRARYPLMGRAGLKLRRLASREGLQRRLRAVNR